MMICRKIYLMNTYSGKNKTIIALGHVNCSGVGGLAGGYCGGLLPSVSRRGVELNSEVK